MREYFSEWCVSTVMSCLDCCESLVSFSAVAYIHFVCLGELYVGVLTMHVMRWTELYISSALLCSSRMM